MAKKKSVRKSKVDSLKPKDGSKVKGGYSFSSGGLSQVLKSLGEGLSSMARKA